MIGEHKVKRDPVFMLFVSENVTMNPYTPEKQANVNPSPPTSTFLFWLIYELASLIDSHRGQITDHETQLLLSFQRTLLACVADTLNFNVALINVKTYLLCDLCEIRRCWQIKINELTTFCTYHMMMRFTIGIK